MALTTRVMLDILSVCTNPLDLRTPRSKMRVRDVESFAAQTDNNIIWNDTRVIAGGALDAIDLYTQTDAFDRVIAFEYGALLYVKTDQPIDVVFDGGVSANLYAGGSLLWMVPISRADLSHLGHNPLLSLTNVSASPANVDVVVMGRGAIL